MKSIACCTPRQAVLDGSEDFVVNLSSLATLDRDQAADFLDSNVLTSGMSQLVTQCFGRLGGGPGRGIYKLSESMGGGKTQSMIVTGLLARFPDLAASLPLEGSTVITQPDHVIAFTGRSTDENVWVTIGTQLGASFDDDRAPSEKQWADLFDGRRVLILLDELAFYLVHAASQGTKEQGERFSKLASIALTNLFGAVRDHQASANTVLVVADLQKDWEQGQDDLNRIMKSNASLCGRAPWIRPRITRPQIVSTERIRFGTATVPMKSLVQCTLDGGSIAAPDWLTATKCNGSVEPHQQLPEERLRTTERFDSLKSASPETTRRTRQQQRIAIQTLAGSHCCSNNLCLHAQRKLVLCNHSRQPTAKQRQTWLLTEPDRVPELFGLSIIRRRRL